jgi:hypothetical protein
MRQLPLIAGAICALATATAAAAQTGVERVWLDANVGSAIPAEDSFEMRVSVPHAGEPAEFGAHHHLPGSVTFDFGGGFMITPVVGIGVSMGGSAHEAQADLTAHVPHPYFANAFAEASGQTDIPMQRIERNLSVQAMLVAVQTRRLRLRAFGGPTWFRIQQDAVTDLTYNQFYFIHSRTNVAELTDYEFERIDGSGWGFHAGADGSLFFTRVLGVGGFARYSRGSIHLENTVARAFGQREMTGVTAGGVQVGGGLRLKF